MLDTSYEATLRRLAPIVGPLCESLQYGIDGADEVYRFRGYRAARHAHLWSHLARTEALQMLERHRLVADEDDERAESDPPLSAIRLQHGPDILKVRLSRDGDVPQPGTSVALASFYGQQTQLPGMETNNLLLLWRPMAGKLITPLHLVRPVRGGRYKRDLLVGWRGPLAPDVASLRAADLNELRPLEEQRELGSDDGT